MSPPIEQTGTALGLSTSARSLLNAFVDISSDLDMHSVLDRIVVAACALTDARYGAVGVIGSNGEMADFITHGLSAEDKQRIGELPRGRGVLRELMEHPEPLRLARLQDHEHSFGFPVDHPLMSSFLGVPIRIRGTVFGNLYLTEKAGGAAFSEQDELLVQALATAAGFVIENARAFAQSERRRLWLEAAVRISEALQPPIQLAAALQQVVIAARRVTDAAAVAVVQRLDTDENQVSAVDGPAAARTPDLVARLGTAVHRCDTSGRQEVVDDGAEATVALMPLKAHLASSGVLLVLLDTGRGGLAGEERELLMAFADQASLALDRAQAVEDRGELAVVSDRDRIARDLHDLVIQQLFATGMQLQGARRLSDVESMSARIGTAVDDLDGTIRDIRSTIFELQSDEVQSLRTELRSLVSDYVPVLGFTPSLRTDGPIDTAVSEATGRHLLAVLREALSNVARHALARGTALEVRVSNDDVLLRVVDDGVGLPSERRESGLRNARRRAQELGGVLRLLPTDPHGTTLEWQVPLER